MAEKIVSQLNADGYFECEVVADESPLEPGVFLLPAGSVDLPPPVIPAGKRARLVGDAFVLEDAPEPTPEAIQETIQMVKAARRAAYQNEADPLFFKAQRDEGTMDEWRAKVAEIRARFPEPAAD